MNILLIDNEAEVRSTLKSMLENWGKGKHTIAEADGVVTGVQAIFSFHPDVVVLDVEMDDGTGFDLLKQIPEPSFQLIFATAFNDYAILAFKFSAIDYLLKPVDPMELATALQKAANNINSYNLQQQLAILMQQMEQKQGSHKQIVLKDIDKTYFVNINSIIYCEAEGSYTKFFIEGSEPIFVSRNLRSYEELLAPSGFIRTHHSCLVNPAKIKVFDRKTDCGTLILEGGFSIPVSQRKREFVIQFLENR